MTERIAKTKKILDRTIPPGGVSCYSMVGLVLRIVGLSMADLKTGWGCFGLFQGAQYHDAFSPRNQKTHSSKVVVCGAAF